MELYKKYRPKKFKDIIGNKETVRSLQNMLEKGTLPHTLLFHGPSGCGKTTLARILKNKLKCSKFDFTELNCSDFRGIDTVRDIARTMNLAPMKGKYKIWLLDEVQMLTKEAQHSALKILEDTPNHIYFFLCTTEPGRLLKTILTRCCGMPVRNLSYNEIKDLLKEIIKKEKLNIEKSVIEDIADNSQGSARTALVLLDKIKNLKGEDIEEALSQKIEEEQEAIELCRALIKKEPWMKIIDIIKNLKTESESIRWMILGYAKAVLLKSKNHQAYIIIDCFKEPFFYSKQAGLVRACYESLYSD